MRGLLKDTLLRNRERKREDKKIQFLAGSKSVTSGYQSMRSTAEPELKSTTRIGLDR